MKFPKDIQTRVARFKREYQPVFEALMPILDHFKIQNRHGSHTNPDPDRWRSWEENASQELKDIITLLTHKDPKGFVDYGELGISDREFSTAECLDHAKRHFKHMTQDARTKDSDAERAAEGYVLLERLGDAFGEERGFGGDYGGNSFISDLIIDVRKLYAQREAVYDKNAAAHAVEESQALLDTRMQAARARLQQKGVPVAILTA